MTTVNIVRTSVVFLLLFLFPGTRIADAAPVINGDFEGNKGFFQVPLGWVPYGEAKYDARHEDNWKAQLVDVPARHSAGLYQPIPGAKPGTRYRLKADVKSGHEQLSVRIGLCTGAKSDLDQAVWSDSYTRNEWGSVSVECTAGPLPLIVFLEIQNTNQEHTLLQGGAWDNIELVEIGSEVYRVLESKQTAGKPAFRDPYASLADLWSLAWPKDGVRTYLAGSHHPDPENNTDFNRAEGTITDGTETWTVLKSFEGPGAILRIWFAGFERAGLIRVQVDGDVVIDETLTDFFGSPGLCRWPLTNRTSGGWMSYTPIVFSKSARVLVKDAAPKSFYWQITWQQFESVGDLRPLKNPLNPTDAEFLRQIRAQWSAATIDPKPALSGTREESGQLNVPAGGSVDVWKKSGAGMVAALHLDAPVDDAARLQSLRVKAYWDGSGTPQVDAPLGLFFNVAYDKTITRGLLLGMAPPGGGYCYYPMPFAKGARLVIQNTGEQSVEDLRFRIRWVPIKPREVSPMRFHAHTVHDEKAGDGKLFIPLEVAGSGHFVGLSAGMARGNGNDVHFLEGDEYVWVDGETEPSMSGTGTEDYFTCGWYYFNGPLSLAPVGATEVNHEVKRIASYRQHISDWIPFNKSFKFALEVGDRTSSPEYGHYTTVAYYYLKTQQ